ncbi:MAG TPA: histidine phosphatase family protein [Devosia sp.]|nr:histidine phosphatase family protein [Devosia sp.]
MTTTFYLVRHAAHDNVGGFLAGRKPGVVLGKDGLAQAERLGQRMKRESFSTVYASPRERTQQTAAAITSACGTPPAQTSEALDEVDFGPWSGNAFDVLNKDPAWLAWNSTRSLARAAGGESMLDVQKRVIDFMLELARSNPDGRLVLVSHADVIKTAAGFVLGLPIDAWPRFDVGPASITTIVLGDWGAKLLKLNEVID